MSGRCAESTSEGPNAQSVARSIYPCPRYLSKPIKFFRAGQMDFQLLVRGTAYTIREPSPFVEGITCVFSFQFSVDGFFDFLACFSCLRKLNSVWKDGLALRPRSRTMSALQPERGNGRLHGTRSLSPRWYCSGIQTISFLVGAKIILIKN